MVLLIVVVVDLVKCPYKYRDVNPWQINDKKSFLQLDKDGKLSLSTIHDYYYQVQGHLSICNKILFVRQKKVHSVNEYSKMQKKFDSILPSLKAFFLKFILPELLTNSIKSGLLAESPSTSCGVQQPSISCSNNYDDVLEQEAEFYQSRISSENDEVPYCICKQSEFRPMMCWHC